MAKTDWTLNDTVKPDDLNQLGEDVNEAVSVANQAEQNANAYTDQKIASIPATADATPETLVKRDLDGRFKATAPVDSDDVARKAEIDDLKLSVSDGKSKVAAAITDKGIPTAADASFQVMEDNVRSLKVDETGIAWTSRQSAADNNWVSVTFGKGLYVTVASVGVGGRVMTSPDGVNWTLRQSGNDLLQWNSVTFGNEMFVAVASNPNENNVMTSYDGITWTARKSAAPVKWTSVTYGNGLFVAVAESIVSQGTTVKNVMTSVNGIDWTLQIGIGTKDDPTKWQSVTYGNGLFVAVANHSPTTGEKVMTSPDGVNWTLRQSADSNWKSVTYGNGQFVAVSNWGTAWGVMTSPDGITWTSRKSTAVNNYWTSVTYGNGLFVAVAYSGSGNKVMTSPDGITWTSRTSAADNSWQSVTYGNGLFVAVAYTGSGNRVMTSGELKFGSATANDVVAGKTIVTPTGVKNGALPDMRGAKITNASIGYQSTDKTVVVVPGAGAFDNSSKVVINEPDIAPENIRKGATFFDGTLDGTYEGEGYPVPTLDDPLLVNPSENAMLSDVAYSPAHKRFYAVAPDTIIYSPDGDYWQGVGPSTPIGKWHRVATGAGKVVAVSYEQISKGAIVSINGAVWSESTTPVATWSDITYSEERQLFVAVAEAGSTLVMTSPDGVNWTGSQAPASAWKGVAYGNGKFVAVTGDISMNIVMTSSDGVTWTASYTNSQWISWAGVTFGNGRFVAVGTSTSGSGFAMTSVDGLDWTPVPLSSLATWQAISFGDGLFVACARDGAAERFIWSRDGLTWTKVSGIPANNWSGIGFGLKMFVGVATNGTQKIINFNVQGHALGNARAEHVLAGYSFSNDEGLAIQGTRRFRALALTAPLAASVDASSWRSVAFGNGIFVAVCDSGYGMRAMTSTDGNNWTLRDTPADLLWKSVCFGKGLFVAVASSGTGNRVMTSHDGINWTLRASANDNNWQAVTFGKDRFVAVATSGIQGSGAMISFDGITWESNNTTPAPVGWNSITYGKDLFVASGNPSGTEKIMTSTDGITWTKRTSGGIDLGTSVVYGDGIFVCVAFSGTTRMVTSLDGISWTAATTPINGTWYAVTYGDGLFVAIPSNAFTDVIFSVNGINWATNPSIASYWYGATYGNGVFVVVGQAGTTRAMSFDALGTLLGG